VNPRFYFSTCQAGAEKAVKAEIAAEFPGLRFAFSRPGFVTFKEEPGNAMPLVLSRGIFTRLWGEVLGQTKERAGLPALLSLVPHGATLHCFDRDTFEPGREPEGFAPNGNVAAIMSQITGKEDPAPAVSGRPVVGSPVYDLIWVDDFHLFLGRHIHGAFMSGSPGNRMDLALPEGAPSRAWLKIEEALARFKPSMEQARIVLEVGCAPGGATTALLGRGLQVTGVDPQFMDEKVLSDSRFAHIRKPARFLTADELRDCNPDWIVMDMSIQPDEALPELAHVIKVLRNLYRENLCLRQGFLTLKLNDWKFAAEIPRYLERLESIGFKELHPVQLCSNRREFFVWAPRFE